MTNVQGVDHLYSYSKVRLVFNLYNLLFINMMSSNNISLKHPLMLAVIQLRKRTNVYPKPRYTLL